MSIVAESPGFIQVFSNGAVKRFSPPTAAPSLSNTNNKYKSKDVIIDPSKPITARIFLPQHHSSQSQSKSIPILVYFHGGGFCIGSTTWLGYHTFLGNLSSTAGIIVLSVDYRLAPENKLPIPYEDCFAALQWLAAAAGSNPEPWLQDADLSRIFLSGDSAGGNIAHHVAVKAIETNINIRVKGLLPIHPYFGSEARTELEMEESSAGEVAMNDMFWKLSLPEGSDRDYYGCNIEKGSPETTEWWLFPAVVVFVAGLDFLRERGVMYVELLKKKGVRNVSLVDAEGESHVFHAWNPDSTASFLLQNQISSFIQSL